MGGFRDDGTASGHVVATAVAAVAVLTFASAVFASPLMHNYAEFDGEGNMRAAYGPIVDRAAVETVIVAERLHGAKGFLTATEVDKVHIVTRRMSVCIALADEAAFFGEATPPAAPTPKSCAPRSATERRFL